MEQPPQGIAREQPLDRSDLAEAVGIEAADSPEEVRITEGIADALRRGEPIDHETAWLIARAITPGSGALEQLARMGEISPEIDADLAVASEVLPERADTWIAALEGYCFRRRNYGPVVGWPTDNS